MGNANQRRVEYYEIPGFENVYLEDSYLLDVVEKENEVRFVVEVVLNESHPRYAAPKEGEQYCYVRGEILFLNVSSKSWVRKVMRPIADPSGEADYGNIDMFYQEGKVSHVSGEWGEIEIDGSDPELKIN